MIIIIITSCDFSCELSSSCECKKLPPTCAYSAMEEKEITTCYVSSSSFSFLCIVHRRCSLSSFSPDKIACGFQRTVHARRLYPRKCKVPNVKRKKITLTTHKSKCASTERVPLVVWLNIYLTAEWALSILRALRSKFCSWALRLISAANCRNAFKWTTPLAHRNFSDV